MEISSNELRAGESQSRFAARSGSEMFAQLRWHDLRVFYQPVVALRTGIVVGVEALVRWQHPTRGLLSPDTFIPKAEASGLVVDIDDWVMQTACLQVARWLRDGSAPATLFVSVNLSAISLSRPFLSQRVEQTLQANRLESRHLQVELTESAPVRHVERAARALEEVRQLGVRVALDDFATGYSLGSLQAFRVDVLKLDQSLVQHVDRRDPGSLVVRRVIELAQMRDLTLIAEGVGIPSQAISLLQLGCEDGQGFLFGRPETEEAARDLLKRRLGPVSRALTCEPRTAGGGLTRSVNDGTDEGSSHRPAKVVRIAGNTSLPNWLQAKSTPWP